MADISFGGLASGLQTEEIIKGLMEVERLPLDRLETKKEYQEARLTAYEMFDTKLDRLFDSAKDLSYTSSVRQNQVSQSSSDAFTATASAADVGSYQVTVDQLAQVQKSVSDSGYASKTDSDFGTGTLTLTVAGEDFTISPEDDNGDGSLSLLELQQGINAGTNEHGVSASIIDDGTEGGDRYHLVLTGADSSKTFSLDTTGLSGGSDTLNTSEVQTAQDALVHIDGIAVTSSSNTIKDAISGVTLNLNQVSPDDGTGNLTPTSLAISPDQSAVVDKVQGFVDNYNDIMSYIHGQSATEDSEAGILIGDSGINSVKRHLQSMLSSPIAGDGAYQSLAELGISTNKDGSLEFESADLTAALSNDFDSVVNVLAGEDQTEGVFKKFKSYLMTMTSPSTGLLASKRSSITSRIQDLDDRILDMEARLDQREQRLEAEFVALEGLMAEMNSQSDYLTQQMKSLSDMMSGGK
jgi:flagellar hook-associated protein 2